MQLCLCVDCLLLLFAEPDGSYVMHEDGEVDVRGVYCCASVATLLNLMHTPSSSPLFANSASWVSSCQTYEGGFSAVPFSEAHGGYTFCGWASLNLLDRVYLCEMESLVKWLSSRQMAFEVTTKIILFSFFSFQAINNPHKIEFPSKAKKST